MEQLDVIGKESQDEILGNSDLLKQTIAAKGLIVVITEKLFDARPCSLILASLCSTGGTFGPFSIPCNNVLHVDGKAFENSVRDQMASCSLETVHDKIHYLTFPTLNGNKIDKDEEDLFLTHRDGRTYVDDMIDQKAIDVVIFNSYATCANH